MVGASFCVPQHNWLRHVRSRYKQRHATCFMRSRYRRLFWCVCTAMMVLLLRVIPGYPFKCTHNVIIPVLESRERERNLLITLSILSRRLFRMSYIACLCCNPWQRTLHTPTELYQSNEFSLRRLFSIYRTTVKQSLALTHQRWIRYSHMFVRI